MANYDEYNSDYVPLKSENKGIIDERDPEFDKKEDYLSDFTPFNIEEPHFIEEGPRDAYADELSKGMRTKASSKATRKIIYRFIRWYGYWVLKWQEFIKRITSRQDDVEERQKELEQRYDEQISGNTSISEIIDARGVFNTLKRRLDDMQSKIEDLNPTEKVFTLTHNQREHVSIRVVTGVNGLGIVPLSAPLGGLDVKEIPATATYESLNTVTVLVPLKYKMSNPKIIRVASNQYLLAEGNRTLIIYVGDKREANVETTITQTFTMDFKGKVAFSLVENPNLSRLAGDSTLLLPSSRGFYEFNQGTYDEIKNLDNIASVATNSKKGNMVLRGLSFNVLEDCKRKFPELFKDLTTAQQVSLLKKLIIKSYPSVYAKGSNNDGNKATMHLFSPTEDKYVVAEMNNSDTIRKLGLSLSSYGTSFYLNSNGVFNVLVNSEPSDGKIPSTLAIDYASFEYTVSIPFLPIN